MGIWPHQLLFTAQMRDEKDVGATDYQISLQDSGTFGMKIRNILLSGKLSLLAPTSFLWCFFGRTDILVEA
jgi:hypothetical protein